LSLGVLDLSVIEDLDEFWVLDDTAAVVSFSPKQAGAA
jgi:hypothetical protein